MNNLQFEHIRNPDFIGLVQKLPQNIQRRAARQFQILQENPLYPSLHFKKVAGLWSIRITNDYRALGYENDGQIIWYWIGPHSEYEKMIRRSKTT
jgi:plasmid maintenance system killer protein